MTRSRVLGWVCLWMVSACTELNPYMATGADAATEGTGSGSTANPSTSGTSSADTEGGPATTADTTQGSDGSDPTDVGDESSSGGALDCAGAGGICVALAPKGWQGPAALRESVGDGPAPECDGDYPVFGVEAFDDLEVAPAECECACAESIDAECGQITVERFPLADVDCSDAQSTWWTGPDCAIASPSMTTAASSTRWRAASEVVSGSCAPQPATVVPPATFLTRSTLCMPDVSDTPGCGAAEACVPTPGAPYDGRTCIWTSGDVECPDEWTDRISRFAGVSDDRACSECTCGAAAGECGGTLVFNTGECEPDATVSVSVPIASDGCITTQSELWSNTASVADGALEPVATCQPSSPAPVGDAEPAAPVTVCCLP